MDLARDAATIARALETLSPSQIINSPLLLPRFQEFLSRCTEIERQSLLRSSPCTMKSDLRHSQDDMSKNLLELRSSDQGMSNSSSTYPVVDEDLDSACLNIRPVVDEDLNTESHSASSLHTSACAQTPASPSLTHLAKSEREERSKTDSLLQYRLSRTQTATSLEINDMSFQELPQVQAFFEQRLGLRVSRTKHLVRAVMGFVQALNLDATIYENMWSARGNIFAGGGSDPAARFHRLCEGFARIRRGQQSYECANRLCHIFLEHDLEQLIASGSFRLSRGRGRKTCALSVQATNLGADLASLRADRKAGRNYSQLLMEAGPGLLLIVGSKVHTIWERKLSKEDVTLILAFLKERVPQILEKGRSLDKTGARLIFDGLISYGWTYAELDCIQSNLLDRLRQCIHFPQLEYQQRRMPPLIEDLATCGALNSVNSKQTGSCFNERATHVNLAPSKDADPESDESRNTLQFSFDQSSGSPDCDFAYGSACRSPDNGQTQIALQGHAKEIIRLDTCLLEQGHYKSRICPTREQFSEPSTASPTSTTPTWQFEHIQDFDLAGYSLANHFEQTNPDYENPVIECHSVDSRSGNVQLNADIEMNLAVPQNTVLFPVAQGFPDNIEGWMDERAYLTDGRYCQLGE